MYKLVEDGGVIKTNSDGSTTSFLFIDGNSDYAEYLKWLDKGNIPEPADPLPIPTVDELRRAEFPNEHDLIVALWERIVEDRPESSGILQAKRVIVKEKYPK